MNRTKIRPATASTTRPTLAKQSLRTLSDSSLRTVVGGTMSIHTHESRVRQ